MLRKSEKETVSLHKKENEKSEENGKGAFKHANGQVASLCCPQENPTLLGGGGFDLMVQPRIWFSRG